MEISRKSRIYRFAYFWTEEYERPRQVNLCAFFWRLVITTLWSPFAIVSSLVLVALGSVIAFLFAQRLTLSKADEFGLLAPFKHWPTIMGHRVYPIASVPIIIPVLFFSQIKENLNYYILQHFAQHLTMMAVITTAGVVALAIVFLKSTDTRRIVWAYLQAKKEKVCPIMKIVD